MDVQSNNILYQGKDARIIVANDITERLKYIIAIEEQNKKLREISWMQSHVIRAPLARIMGLIPLIDNVKESPVERKKMLEYLKISSNELDEVIFNITQKIGGVDYN
jgi:signal transduction histidine kinase